MKKIGFIDYFIDEFHANKYPTWIRESSFKDRFDVSIAWEEVTPEGKISLESWCAAHNVQHASCLEEVVEKSDCLVILSPDNPERHEMLADLALRSGKPVYIDKPLAPSLKAACRLFDQAEKCGTPLMSCSALRFDSNLQEALRNRPQGATATFASTRGGGSFAVYAIHQIEMLVQVMGTGATRVRFVGKETAPLMIIDYSDGRWATMQLMAGHPFQISVAYEHSPIVSISPIANFFPNFIEEMLLFFETSVSKVPKQETLEIAALLEAGHCAMLSPEFWHSVNSF